MTPVVAFHLLRPQQWIKNALVFTPWVFAARTPADLLNGLIPVVVTFAAFSLTASAVYAINDVIDADRDRLHPLKRHRPVASGVVAPATALALAAACAAMGLTLSGLASWEVTAYLVGYLVNNYVYSIWLKHVQLLDVFSLSLGFLLRVYAGAAAVDAPVSAYLFLTVLFLTLYLGLGKRRFELRLAKTDRDGGQPVSPSGPDAPSTVPLQPNNHRYNMYSIYYLDQLMLLTATMTLVLYTMYTLIEAAPGLVPTVPVVSFGIFRYYHLTHNLDRGEPSDDLVGDRWILTSSAVFAALVLWRLVRSA